MKLFRRAYRLIIDTIEIAGGDGVADSLDIDFKIEKTNRAEPNKAEIKIYNLNDDHRNELVRRFGSQVEKSKRKPLRVELEAGYEGEGNRGLIFAGDLRNLIVKREGQDFVTTISGADGGHAFKTGRISRAFGAGTSVSTVLRACVDALGIGTGNLSEFEAAAKLTALGTQFSHGTVLSGSAERELDHLVKAAGLEWSVQNGSLQLRRKGQPVQAKAYRLAADTGLVGVPFPEVDATVLPNASGKPNASKTAARRSGLVNCKTLIIPSLAPGQKVDLDSEEFKGGYQIMEMAFQGQTFGNDWYIQSKVRPY